MLLVADMKLLMVTLETVLRWALVKLLLCKVLATDSKQAEKEFHTQRSAEPPKPPHILRQRYKDEQDDSSINNQVLENGLLIDPHDQQSTAYALLKLLADKQLWAKWRANGLRDISSMYVSFVFVGVWSKPLKNRYFNVIGSYLEATLGEAPRPELCEHGRILGACFYAAHGITNGLTAVYKEDMLKKDIDDVQNDIKSACGATGLLLMSMALMTRISS
ncbi:hypothetical protein CTI12_AA277650 [Artemisia annua]|uniref:Uncharacterized protein n=1 Tax=Artemisia annua TaxID=35608 RepID=A0A2U1NE42_ARTAN|nr:hypothetical protein CTI12_AA277650 [Artemisia annua]